MGTHCCLKHLYFEAELSHAKAFSVYNSICNAGKDTFCSPNSPSSSNDIGDGNSDDDNDVDDEDYDY